MATILLTDLAKEYNYSTIFSGINYLFEAGASYAIKGANGTGKSTLLQCILGYQKPSHGSILWTDTQGQTISASIPYFSFSAPYMELIEEYTVEEFLAFVSTRWSDIFDRDLLTELLSAFSLDTSKEQIIKKLSSGQKQKINLIQAFCQKKEVLILDEPTSFLDTESIDIYQKVLHSISNRTIIVASNTEADFTHNSEALHL